MSSKFDFVVFGHVQYFAFVLGIKKNIRDVLYMNVKPASCNNVTKYFFLIEFRRFYTNIKFNNSIFILRYAICRLSQFIVFCLTQIKKYSRYLKYNSLKSVILIQYLGSYA